MAGYQQRWLDELGNTMWKLYKIKTNIFREKNLSRQDQMLYEMLSGYFHPNSGFRKV